METDAPKYDRISSVLRFTRDKRGDKNLKIQINEDRLLNHRLRHGLLINEYSTPVLENAVARVCERLEFPRKISLRLYILHQIFRRVALQLNKSALFKSVLRLPTC